MNKPWAPEISGGELSTAPSWIERGNNALWLVGLLWLECAVIMLFHNWSRYAGLEFLDPDDSMRMVQVRDFLAGQSWFDVSQHRVNPPFGGPMHWSRLVDVPIATVILMLRPLLGQASAELVAAITVPLLTLAVMCFAMFGAVRRFLGVHKALLTVALLVTSFPILVQAAPLRIDHHGWQIAMAAFALWGVLDERPGRGGIVAGCAMAMWLHISTEGLPDAAVAGGVISLRYVWRATEWPRLIGYTGALFAATMLLLLGVRGWTTAMEFHCDGISVAYFPEFFALFAVMAVTHRLVGGESVARRIAVPAAAALATVALYATASRPCLGGPFYYLDPLVYKVWYLGILEGLPVWRQSPMMQGIIIAPAIVGLIGLFGAMAEEKDSDRRAQWLSVLGLALPAFLMSCLMLRAMTFAHLFALVGNCWLLARLYPYIKARAQMLVRVLLTVALAALSPAPLAAGAGGLMVFLSGKPEPVDKDRENCLAVSQIAALNALPTAILFTPVDLGPAILQRSPHSVVATGHHRNAMGLSKVIHAYLGSPDEARKVVLSADASYLLFCPSLGELGRYARLAPDGLAAQMMKGKVPAWLKPVHLHGETAIRVYRVVP